MNIESDLEKITLQECFREYIKKDFLADSLLSIKKSSEDTCLFREINQKSDFEESFKGVVNTCLNGKPLYIAWKQNINGKTRNISVPKPPLKNFIQKYLVPLVKSARVHVSCHGGEEGWSVKKSLKQHLPLASVLSFDLSNAFENFPALSVYYFFDNILKDYSDKEKISHFLTLLCTVKYSHGRGLPIGSGLSMALFNRALYDLDEKLYNVSIYKGFRYSRWVDDLTISSSFKKSVGSFFGAVELTNRKYSVSDKKTYFQENDKDIFLLGHKITPDGKLFKNSKEERIRDKQFPLNYEKIIKQVYESWN